MWECHVSPIHNHNTQNGIKSHHDSTACTVLLDPLFVPPYSSKQTTCL